ncbi:hypothetical protein ACWD26_38400 [Streptomyces sp. NPDC002787]
MHLVSRALAWVRAVLFGLPEPDDHRQPLRTGFRSAPEPPLPARCPSPETWAAFLASARRRRAPHPQPRTELPLITADDIASTLVGAYLLTPEVRQRILHARKLTEAH